MLASSLQEADTSARHFIKQESTHTPAISSWKVETGGSEVLHHLWSLGECEASLDCVSKTGELVMAARDFNLGTQRQVDFCEFSQHFLQLLCFVYLKARPMHSGFAWRQGFCVSQAGLELTTQVRVTLN